MSTHYYPYNPDEPAMLPPSPQDWLPVDHIAYSVRDIVEHLDLTAIRNPLPHCRFSRGAPAFDPLMMVGLLLYSWANDVFSSRRISDLCLTDIGGRYLSAGYQPDFRTICKFRNQNYKVLDGLFAQSVRLCQMAGMVPLHHVAIDGTKIAANASKHKAMSYERMVEAEKQLELEIAEYHKKSREIDKEEDARLGKDALAPKIESAIAWRQGRKKKIAMAMAALEAANTAAEEAKKAARAAKEEAAGKPLPGRKPKENPTPKPTAQSNFTDEESRIMKSGSGGYVQGYNAQAAVDSEHQVIVGCDLTNMAADAPHFESMLSQAIENTGAKPAEVSADAGYFSEANVATKVSPGTDILIPPDRMQHGAQPEQAEQPVETGTEEPSVRDLMRQKLSADAGRASYAKRKITVEPTFGQIKGCPGSPGFRHIMRRGLKKAREEWRWVCATHNFKKYIKFTQKPSQASPRVSWA